MTAATEPRTAEDALAEVGFSGRRLLALAHKGANDELRRRGAYMSPEQFEDLVSFLVLVGLKAALRYDPDRVQRSYGSNGGERFSSYVSDLMALRITDYYRSRANGLAFGDRRYGNDGRVTLTGDPLDDPADTELDFERLVSERRLLEWQEAARAVELPVTEWIVVTLDKAAAVLRRTA